MRYQKIYAQIWHDDKFRTLSQDAKYLFLYLLTSPHNNAIGCFVLPKKYIESDLNWKSRHLGIPLRQLCEKNFIKMDESVNLIAIINHLKYNKIENINQKKAAIKLIKTLPQSFIFQEVMHLKELCDYAQNLGNPLPNPLPNPSETLCLTLPKGYGNSETETETETEAGPPYPPKGGCLLASEKKQEEKEKPPENNSLFSFLCTEFQKTFVKDPLPRQTYRDPEELDLVKNEINSLQKHERQTLIDEMLTITKRNRDKETNWQPGSILYFLPAWKKLPKPYVQPNTYKPPPVISEEERERVQQHLSEFNRLKREKGLKEAMKYAKKHSPVCRAGTGRQEKEELQNANQREN